MAEEVDVLVVVVEVEGDPGLLIATEQRTPRVRRSSTELSRQTIALSPGGSPSRSRASWK